MQYAIIIEKGENGFSAYAPDLPGCLAADEPFDGTMALMKEAIEFHLEGMKLNGELIPELVSVAESVKVAVL